MRWIEAFALQSYVSRGLHAPIFLRQTGCVGITWYEVRKVGWLVAHTALYVYGHQILYNVHLYKQ